MFSRKSYENCYTIHSMETPYKCKDCTKSFSKPNHLKLHRKIHINDKPFKCEECNKYYKNKTSLKLHQWRFHRKIKKTNLNLKLEKSIYECYGCKQLFPTKEVLDEHRNYNKTGKIQKCDKCNLFFANPNCFKLHLETHTIGHQSESCNESFNDRLKFTKHRKFHEDVDELAYYDESEKSDTKEHHSMQSKHDIFENKQSKKISSQESELGIHGKASVAILNCTKCDAVFDKLGPHLKHKRICEGKQDTFGERSDLIQHRNYDKNINPVYYDKLAQIHDFDERPNVQLKDQFYQSKEGGKISGQESDYEKTSKPATTRKCPKCGNTFDKLGPFLKHENTCKGKKK